MSRVEAEVDGEQTLRRSTRDKKPTQKGMWWQIDTLQKNFRRAISAWNSCSNKVEVLLSDTIDTRTIREHRDTLIENMSQVTSIYKQLTHLIEIEGQSSEHSDLVSDIEIDLNNKYEKYEDENSDIMKRITRRLQELDNLDSKSKRSGSSSHRTNTTERSHTASRAAELKAKLKFMDLQAKAQLELDKIKTMCELEATEAKLDVLDKSSRVSELDDLKRSLPDANILDKFLQQVNPENELECDINDNIIKDDLKVPKSTNITTNPNLYEDNGIATLNASRTVQIQATPESVSQPVFHGPSVPLVSQIVSGRAQPSASASVPLVSQPVLSQSMPAYVNPPVSQGLNTVPVTQNVLNPSATAFVPQGANTASHTGHNFHVDDLTRSLAEQVSLGRLPPPEPSVFYGDPLKYPAWKASFQTLIEQRKIPQFERIHYLRKYVGDSVREVIENFLVLSTEDAYEDAKELLEKRYGDPFIIGNAFRDRLERWPKIQSRDNIGLRKFSDFLRQCASAMRTMGTLNSLNDDRENRKLLSKLPDWIVTRWSRIVAKHKDENHEFPSFRVFADFVEKEATIANDPVTSIQSVRTDSTHNHSDRMKNRFQRGKPDQCRNLATETSQSKPENSSKPWQKDRSCFLCKKPGHNLDTCRQFLAKPVADRKEFAKEKGLCFGCLGHGHTSKNCKNRTRCTICSRMHPTSLHGDYRNTRGTSNATSDPSSLSAPEPFPVNIGAVHMNFSQSNCKSSMIVPVYVSHTSDPSNERLVYALLDTQSDTTFILEDTYRALGLSGNSVKLSLSTMHSENTLIDSCKIGGLMVRGYDSKLKIPLPPAYTRDIMPANRSHIPTAEMASHWSHLEVVADKLMPLNDCEFGLLIGYDCARALTPREVIPAVGNGPYAQKTDLGWGIVGIIDPTRISDDSIGFSHRIIALEVQPINRDVESKHVQFSIGTRTKELSPSEVLRMMELDFSDRAVEKQPMSREDKRFLSILEENIRLDEGHYEMPLPFKGPEPIMKDNRSEALKRFEHLRKRLIRDTKYRNDYLKSMDDLIVKGYAERAKTLQVTDDGKYWYIPHHGVYHPQKPEKIRIVFDCSAKHRGSSLNDHLLQGPDLINSLIGVLNRFRQEQIAIVCDIEQMFLQFKVKPEHRDYLRFLWFEDCGDLSAEPVEYRMNVHLFGAASSPGCANFGLKRIADDNESEFGLAAANFIRKDFYVDDGLKSVASCNEAVELVKASQAMCNKGGLRLHKFRSNSKDVLRQINPNDRANDMKNLDLLHDELPITKTLGVQWCIESDTFQFRIILNDKPCTRRGILSTLSSIYDPLGFISPVVLVAKRIFQDCCVDRDDWDSELSEDIVQRWELWLRDVLNLETLEIQRCVKPEGFDRVTTCEIHHFSDASITGYGQCSYLRLVNEDGQVHCALLMSKARVVPRKSITIPRLELSAAVVSVRISRLLRKELEFDDIVEWFWTDSNIVLGYISNESRRFHVFVSNRVQQILDYTAPEQWKYIDTNSNPADIASRGSSAKELVDNTMWLNGPSCIWTSVSFSPDGSKPELDQSDPEVKRVKTLNTKVDDSYCSILERLDYFSDWQRARKAIAICLNLKDSLRNKSSKTQICSISVEDISRAEIEIIRHVQRNFFKDELDQLRTLGSVENSDDRQFAKMRNVSLKQTSSLYKLDPFLDSEGIIRVGGRIKRSDFDSSFKHPVIVPKNSHVTNLVIRHCHELVRHQGRGFTINEIRSQGYWIIGCCSAVSKYIFGCVTCRKLRGTTQVQKMADLPNDRMETAPPFTYCGVDLFGPFLVKEGRKEIKRYGVIFTCLASRAVHIETANSLDTSSFINALRRMIAIRGPVRHLRSDQGSNFVGAKRELREALSEMDSERIRNYLLDNSCDYVEFKMNAPHSSHMGGIWERQIRSIRNVLQTLLDQLGCQLDDESLRTFMCEAASIVNSRPLTTQNLNDPTSNEPITPNHLLTLKSQVILPPPGEFLRNDVYSRKRWRRVQFLANQFWDRWRKEYISNLQSRQKWISQKRNMSVGDIVLIKDENLARNMWHIARIIETFVDADGLVRKAKLVVGSSDKHSRLSVLERPIHKLVLIKETEEFPTEESA